jgi:aryl sulfotransferase
VEARLHRYRSPDEDSGRWERFALRPDDIVISTRSKSGTTWMQMICALLVLRTPQLPAPLATLSPWLDWLVVPEDVVFQQLAAQRHRRFIKTHTPLDGVPVRPGVSYVVVARHPLDMAVSLYHQAANLDRERIAALTGNPVAVRRARPPLDEWLVSWAAATADPRAELDSLPGVLHHLTDAWRRRDDERVVLVHYDDLCADLSGEMRRVADRLGIDVPEAVWPSLVGAATFDRMRERADQVAPDPAGILRDRARFFRRGTSGAGEEVLPPDALRRYRERVADLAPPGLVGWLHRSR